MMPTVRPVTRAAASTGSRLSVSGSTSAKTGVPPSQSTASAVAKKLKAGTMTSSPGSRPSARRERISASVPLATATHAGSSRSSAKAFSNSRTSGPRTYEFSSRMRAQRVSSSEAIRCRARFRSRMGMFMMRRIVPGYTPRVLSRFRFYWRFYWVVGVCGAILMALEILSSRVLAPHFGNSVYVWGSIISVFLAALSAGYLWGGRLADRHPSIAALGRLLALAASFQALLLWVGSPLASWLGGVTGATPAGTLLATSVLFGPASILLATVSPYAVRLAIHDLGSVGNTAGRLYALSTLGSLAGTLGCTFGLIPYLELRQIIGLLALLTAVTALFALAGGFRAEMAASALAALLVIACVPAVFSRVRLTGDVIYERVTPYQTLVVHERGRVRTLESDRIQQAGVDLRDGEPALHYPRWSALALVLNPRIERMLVLGLGGGSTGGYLQRRVPHLRIDSVDVDPAVPEVAR